MKILKYKDFVNEKLNIQPVSKERLGKMGKSIPKINKGELPIDNLADVDILYHNFEARGIDLDTNLRKLYTHTLERFNDWEKLPFSEQRKKHLQRADKKMTKSKVVATLYAALERYGNKPEFSTVIDKYIERVMRECNLDKSDIIDLYFELPF